jgi:hypothetical protein
MGVAPAGGRITMFNEWKSDAALFIAGAIAICAMATCQVKREQNWKEIELRKLETQSLEASTK